MKLTRHYFIFVFVLIFLSSITYASTPAVSVITTEYVSQVVAYDQVYGDDDNLIEAPGEEGENRTGQSRTNVTLSDARVWGNVNITNVEDVGNYTFSSINVTLVGTENISAWGIESAPSYLNNMVNLSVDWDNPGGANEVSIFLPELRVGDTLLINFTVIPSTYQEPLNFTEEYSNWRVLTGHDINITLNVSNNFAKNVALYDLEIYKIPHLYPSTEGGYAFFSYSDIGGEDASNASINIDGHGRTVLNWNASSGILDPGENRSIHFNATAPANVSIDWANTSDWALWMNMGNLTSSFKLNGSITGFHIQNVSAVSTAAKLAVSKTRINASSYWNATLNLTNDAISELDYEVQQISVWATKYQQYSDPGNQSTWINNTDLIATEYGLLSDVTVNATWFPRINLSDGSSMDNYSLVFNYSLVPIVWATADFVILDDGTQIYKLNQSKTHPTDEYLFIEEIYVLLGGYLMKVTKELTPLNTSGSVNRYMVNITLENIGTERTPELVTVFDLLPKDFEPMTFSEVDVGERNMTSNLNIIRITDTDGSYLNNLASSSYVLGAEDTGEILSGPYEGYWGYHIDMSSINATSDGDGIFDASLADKEVMFSYVMKGNHSLAQIDNAYLVGIDPVRLEGANPSQSVASRLAVYSKSLETIVVICSLILSIILLSMAVLIVKNKDKEVNK